LQFFNSTVSPSIMEFYPSVGVKRDVSSKPDVDEYALRGLLSVKYTLVPTDKLAEFRAEADEGWVTYDEQGSYTILENENYLPMGFVVDKYLTEELYDKVAKGDRAKILLRALVLDEEQIAQYGHLLEPLSDEERRATTYADYCEAVVARRIQCCDTFTADNSGFSASITLQQESLVLFTVPWDEGFTATVNGQPVEVLKVDGGLMALPLPAGGCDIRVDYRTVGLREGMAIGGVSFAVWLAYVGVTQYKKRKNGLKSV
ncbi:MAG: YfhO family protein, partial [Oscillospiraceae bacterium]|nr:YfhO family protein [Oscillospiraceae bacterium]